MYHSQQIEKYQTAQIPQWKEGSYDYKATVKYGMHYILGNSSPYFSITVDIYQKNSKGGGWKDSGGGCCHDLIKKRKKALAPLIDFHLCGQDGLPIHYLENGWYWYKEDKKIFLEQCRVEYFEVEDMPVTEKKEVLVNWLMSRTKELKQRFDDIMKHFNVEFITQEEIEALKAKAA